MQNISDYRGAGPPGRTGNNESERAATAYLGENM